jgi:hypothetical protein
VIEALRLFTRMHVSEPANYKIEKWVFREQHVEEIAASTSRLLVGRAAFSAAAEQYPGARLIPRGVIEKADAK